MTINGITDDQNEELLLCIDKPTKQLISQTENYFKELDAWRYVIPINEQPSQQNRISLRDFFLDGNLYIRYQPPNLFTFVLDIPDSLRQAAPKLHHFLDADTKNTISMQSLCYKFNLIKDINYSNSSDPALDSTFDGFLGVVSYDHQLQDLFPRNVTLNTGSESYRSPSWTNYCIETMLGYWAPSFLCPIVDANIELGKDNKSDTIEKIIHLIGTKNFENHLFNFFDELSVAIYEESMGKEEWDAEKIKNRWLKWRKHLFSRIITDESDESDESEVDKPSSIVRMSSGISKASFFDIFTDNDFSEDFIDSVINFLHYKIPISKQKNKIVKILKDILKQLEMENIENSKELLEIIQDQGRDSFINQLKFLKDD
jgi:hypothetical protein